MSSSSSSSLSQASGSYVHRGTQPSVAATSASVPSSSSTPLDIPLRSSTSSKRKTSPFDVSTRSSASSKRRKPSATAEMSEFKEVFVKLSHRINDVLLQEPVAPPPPPPPPPAPAPASVPASVPVSAPASLTKAQTEAVMHFLESSHASKEAGDEWVSSVEIGEVATIFSTQNSVAELYLIFSKLSEQSATCSWVCNQVLHRGAGL
jgi:hypothetical protein